MAYFLDLTNVSDNNYRIVKPNAILNSGIVNGTFDFDITGGAAAVDDTFPSTFVQSGTPATTELQATTGLEAGNTLTTGLFNRSEFVGTTFDPATIPYNGNGQAMPLITFDFENLAEIPTAQGGAAYLDESTGARHILRLALQNNNISTAANINSIDFTCFARYGSSLVNEFQIGPANITLPNRNTVGTDISVFDIPFTIPVADITTVGGRRAGNLNVFVQQTAGNTAGSARRAFLIVHAVEVYLNVLNISPYEEQHRGFVV